MPAGSSYAAGVPSACNSLSSEYYICLDHFLSPPFPSPSRAAHMFSHLSNIVCYLLLLPLCCSDKSVIVWHLERSEEQYGFPKRSLIGHNHYVQVGVQAYGPTRFLLDHSTFNMECHTCVASNWFVGLISSRPVICINNTIRSFLNAQRTAPQLVASHTCTKQPHSCTRTVALLQCSTFRPAAPANQQVQCCSAQFRI